MDTILHCLTPNLIKRTVFARDVDFVAAMEQVRSRWTSTEQLRDRLWNHASLLLRPDALAGRCCIRVLSVLREHGLVPVAVKSVWLSRQQTRAMWRYQANVATSERLELLQDVMSAGPSIYVLCNDQTVRSSAPATVHVTYMKGTAILSKRRRWHLRTQAGPAIANALSYVHVSDDPADLLRELSVLFDREQRQHVLEQMDAREERTDTLVATISRLERSLPEDALYLDQRPIRRCLDMDETRIRDHLHWQQIVLRAKRCRNFITGETYDGFAATVPDDKSLSLPLDAHLMFSELGPR